MDLSGRTEILIVSKWQNAKAMKIAMFGFSKSIFYVKTQPNLF